MKKIEFNLGKFSSGCQCEKKLWIDINGDKDLKVPFETNNLIEEGKRTKEVAKDYFKVAKCQISGINEHGIANSINETSMAVLDDSVRLICDAIFEVDNCYAHIDMLKKNRKNFEIYYVKASTKVEPRFIDDLAYQYFVASACGLTITKVSLMIINDEYVRKNSLNLKELFSVIDFTDVVKAKAARVAAKIDNFRHTLSDREEPELDVGMHCFEPFACPYFAYCKKELGIPERSIFEIPRQRKSIACKLYDDGVVTLEQALDLELSKPIEKQNVSRIVYLRQETGDKVKDYICRSDLSVFLDSLYYPLYFLDFETFTEAVPSFKGQRPYEQIPFQYSLHYIPKRGDNVHHKEFLAKEGTDPREAISKRLCEDIPDNACVLAYNMSFEKGCIKRLSDYLPEYSEKLDIIYAHIDDLMIPFQKRWYYKTEMHGSYSIKKVLPSLFPGDPALDYHNLNVVHKGDEAMLEFKMLPKYDDAKRLEVREALLRYCELDTFAMVRIYLEIERVVQEEIGPSEEKKKKQATKAAKRKKKPITNQDVIQDNVED